MCSHVQSCTHHPSIRLVALEARARGRPAEAGIQCTQGPQCTPWAAAEFAAEDAAEDAAEVAAGAAGTAAAG